LTAKLAEIAANQSEIEARRLDIAPDEAQRREIELNAQRHDTEQRIKQLEERAAREREAEMAKRRAKHIEKIEGITRAQAALGKTIEGDVATLIGHVRQYMEHSKAIAAAWPWGTGQRVALKLHGQGLRALLCAALYRQSVFAFLNHVGEDQITLPGSVCPRDEWRLRPDKIPSMSQQLEEIADYASRVMRGSNEEVPLPKEEQAA